MFLKLASQVSPLSMFIKFAFFSRSVSAAKAIAWFSFYIATGPVFYYILQGVADSRRKVVFGIEGKEIGPYAGIQVPSKVVILILSGVAVCWSLAAAVDMNI
ncbi:hypothetical protein [Microbulbifer halophilus]|uniref:Uncharacterized protein n=1 Tax=Microbulbifer halophilus TaxID=453963 RepID=A0ABW5EC43_9GAMM|nr:hypothetical protein [Microbulbifer halophilus]MCW8126732.1 hypothetical protein [Microbulbifer halophilus]